MKIISLIGYSGSGKTHFITNVIKRLKAELDLIIVVIKNVHNHKIDTKRKDSFEFSKAGAKFSIIRNNYYETAVFFKKDLSFNILLDWILKLSDNIDLAFMEGFRGLNFPEVLCVENCEDIDPQLSMNVKMISGLISNKVKNNTNIKGLPVINIETDFTMFLEIFGIQ